MRRTEMRIKSKAPARALGEICRGGGGIELWDRRYFEGSRYRSVSAEAVAATISALRHANE